MISGIETIATKAIEQTKGIVDGKNLDGKELPPNNEIPNSDGELRIEKPDIAYIERTTRISLIEQNNIAAKEANQSNNEGEAATEDKKNEGLTDEEKEKIKEETGWSDEIIENIQNMKQYEILKNAGLKEVEVNGRKCLIKENVDLDYTDADGITNRQRMERGQPPLDSKTGKPIELHHLGQRADSPLVELTEEEHRTGDFEGGKKNQSLWHDNISESWRTDKQLDNHYKNVVKPEHWKARFKQLGGNS